MNYRVAVQVAESQHDLRCDELNRCFVKALHLVQIVINVTTWHIFEEEVNSQLVLENVLHMVHKWMVGLEENLLLDLDVFYLVLLEDDVLIQALHRVNLPVLLIFNQEDFAE